MAAGDTFVPIAWRTMNIPLTRILTRNFCLPHELPHYDFCRAYFKKKTIEALKDNAYTKWLPRDTLIIFSTIPQICKESQYGGNSLGADSTNLILLPVKINYVNQG